MTPASPPPNVVAAAAALWQAAGGQHWIAVEGRSMWPLLRPGDAVLVAHGGPPPRPGEVIVVRQDEGLLVHRLLAITEATGQPQYWTQGDARPQPDAPHAPEALLGRVTARKRAGRETPVPVGWVARRVAALHWGARGRRRTGRKLRRVAAQALAALAWGR